VQAVGTGTDLPERLEYFEQASVFAAVAVGDRDRVADGRGEDGNLLFVGGARGQDECEEQSDDLRGGLDAMPAMSPIGNAEVLFRNGSGYQRPLSFELLATMDASDRQKHLTAKSAKKGRQER